MEKQDYIGLHNLVSVHGARKKPKRLGRGESSGHGKTSGRGHKGQKARKSGNVRPGFEGGQNPLMRRLPKQGFKNIFKKTNEVVNLSDIAERFESGSVVDHVALVSVGLVSPQAKRIKVLGKGVLAHPVTLKVHALSSSAKEAVEKVGGSVELLNN